MAEGARLESVYTATYRGFESPPHRHIQDKSSYESTGFFLLYSPDRGDENPRLGFDNWRQPVGQTERAANRLPAGRAKRVNPPLTAIFKIRARTKVRAFFFYIPRTGGVRIPDRGSTTGDSQLDRRSAQRTGCPQGERSESIPPSPPYSR